MKTKLIMLYLIIYALVVAQTQIIKAENKRGVLLHGENYLFYIKAPDGWILDTSNGVSEGLEVVIYPKRASWEKTSTIMFPQIFQKLDFKTGKIEEIIKHYKDDTLDRIPYAKFSSLSSVKTRDKSVARVLKVIHRRIDAVGFIDESEVVVLLVLSSEDNKGFNKSYSAFVELIKSYNFIASKQNIYK